MRASAIVAIVFFGACAPGCLTTQELGPPAPTSDAGDDTPTSASDLRQGFTLPTQTSSCPVVAPTPGAECHAYSGECAYALRDLDQVGRPICGRSCTCAISGKWICATAPCPYLDANTCGEGTACVGAMQCWAQCDQKGSCRHCTCNDGRMTCGDDTGPPK